MSTCEKCPEEGERFRIIETDPDSEHDGTPPTISYQITLCDMHLTELADDDLVLNWTLL